MANTEAELKNRKVKLAKLRTKYTKEALEKKVPVKAYVEDKMKQFRASMTPFKTEIKAKINTVKKTDNKPKEKITETIKKIKKEVSKKDSSYKIKSGATLSIPTPKVRGISKTSNMPSAPPKAIRPVTLKSGEKGTAAQRLAEIEKEKGFKSLMAKVTGMAKD